MWEKYKHIIPHISVGIGVIDTVAAWVLSSGYKTVLLVCDPITRGIAGSRVASDLKALEITVYECCFVDDEPLPDERSIGMVTAAYTPEVDLIIGVGSGTINDICTFVGARVRCPSAIVGTAASMDGYASVGSAMVLGGIKVTPHTQCPIAIFCDVDIMASAPMMMTASGLGDMLGKYTALADWKLSHILTGEPMPEDIAAIVETALEKIVAGVPHLARRSPAVIQSVTEGLILSGLAMSMYGDSRPASGMEHHLSHFWEMRMLAEGIKPALHGIKVGLATVAGLIMWKELCNSLSLEKKQAPARSEAEYESNIRLLYGHSADTILQTENPSLPIEHIRSNLGAILDIANSLPSPDIIAAMLSSVGAPIRPSEILVGEDVLKDSIIYARDRKKTYTLLQLLGDLGCLEDYAKYVSKYFSDTALAGVKCFVLDMDGTIYLSDTLFPYTMRFLEHIRSIGKDYIFYTNNSSQNAAHYLKKLERMGIFITSDKFFMSTHVLLAHLERRCESIPSTSAQPSHATRVFVAGTAALREDFRSAGYTLTEDDPDFAVLGFDTDMDYTRLTKFCDVVRSGLPYYGVHIDYNCPVEGGCIPDCGSLAAAVTASTGVTPEFFGKPSRRTLDYLIEKAGYRESELCFVGDRLYTDIAIASGTEVRSVLVLSGETGRGDLRGSVFVPDLIVSDLAELVDYIKEEEVS